MPAPNELLAQLQAKKAAAAQTAASSSPPAAAAPNPLLAALASRQSKAAATAAAASTPAAAASKKKPAGPPKRTTTEGLYEYDASLESFLFFAEGDSSKEFAPKVIEGNDSSADTHIQIPLAPCIYRMTDYTLAKQEPVSLQQCLLKLGVIRSLQRECQTANVLLRSRCTNATASTLHLEEDEWSKTRFMELLTGTGLSQQLTLQVLQQVSKQRDSSKSEGSVVLQVDGLDAFLQRLETLCPALQQARQEIAESQTVSFYPGLGELFVPGAELVCFPPGMEGAPLGCCCVQSWYAQELNPATGKVKRRFVLVLEFVLSVGTELVFVAASDVYPEFHDASRNLPLKDLKHRRLLVSGVNTNPADVSLLQRLQARGEFYASVAVGNHYLQYDADSFFPVVGGGWSSQAVRPLSKGGRVMVDVQRSMVQGHLPVRSSSATQSGDGLADTCKEAMKLFEQSKRTGVAVPFRTAVLPEFTNTNGSSAKDATTQIAAPRADSDRSQLWMAWPMLTGFSFTARVWGKLLLGMPKQVPKVAQEVARRPSSTKLGVQVAALGGQGACGNCGYISFQEQAFEQLVLEQDKKELIRAVARNAGSSRKKWEHPVDANDNDDIGDDNDDSDDDDEEEIGIDVVANKGGASIFLLSGPPGTGKTLTAEAIAELLKKPLYIVTAGDLGITATEVEKTLGAVLDLCQTWDALVLIDEADVFLEARSSTELERNALVCVMLRLLEYYSGCLFLSSNRSAASIDAAIASRITVMLSYPPLDAAGRTKVWRNLVQLVPALPLDEATGAPLERIVKNPRKACKYRMHLTAEDFTELGASFELNGRQIKNSIVLARALSRERGMPLSLPILRRAVTAVAGKAATVKEGEY